MNTRDLVGSIAWIGLALLLANPRPARAESFTTNILDGASFDAGPLFALGDTGVSNVLVVTGGGGLVATNSVVGRGLGADGNWAWVTGPGSQWLSRSNLYLGAAGSLNEIRIEQGGRAGVGWGLWLGLDPASAGNRLIVDGTNSVFDAIFLHLGYAGAGNRLLVTNGGVLNGNTSRDTTDVIGEEISAHDNELLITGGGSSGRLDHLVVGGDGSRNRVQLADGGRMTTSTAVVGWGTNAAENSILVAGPGSLWTCLSGGLSVGSYGAGNLLRLAEGARLSTTYGGVGTFPPARNNRVELAGPGTRWDCNGGLYVGSGGSDNRLDVTGLAELRLFRLDIGSTASGNTVWIREGGKVVATLPQNPNASLVIGNAASAGNNRLVLHGAGTAWTNSGYVTVGALGSGNALSIQDGAAFIDGAGVNGRLSVGAAEGAANNQLIVTGPKAVLQTKFPLEIGAMGSSNAFWIQDGAAASSGSAVLGSHCQARGNVAVVRGLQTYWTNGLLEVGFCSTGNHLLILDGAQVHAGLVRSSVQGGGLNTIQVRGAGARLNAAGSLYAGNSGHSNRLIVSSGGQVVGRQDFVGAAGSGHTAEITGEGSSWSNLTLNVGEQGQGNALRLADGGRLETRYLEIGPRATAAWNECEMAGLGTRATTTTVFLGGLGSSNRFLLREGASLNADWLQLGGTGRGNEMRVVGPGAQLTVSNQIHVGYGGHSNRLDISGGAEVVAGRSTIGGQGEDADFNSVEVAGPGTRWVNAGELQIGGYGRRCTLRVSDGAVVISGTGNIGAHGRYTVDPGEANCARREGFNEVLVEGAGASWETPVLWVGSNSYGNRLELRAGGKVLAHQLRIGANPGLSPGGGCSTSPVPNELLVNGGRLAVTNPAGDGLLEPRFGRYRQQAGLAVADMLRCTNGPLSRVELAGGTLQVQTGWVRQGAPWVVGDGLRGARLQLVGDPFWSSIKLRCDDGMLISAHAEFSGVGHVQAAVTNAGTVSPGGEAPGVLEVAQWQSRPGSRLHFDIAGAEPGQADRLILGGGVTLGGSLTVAVRGAFVPALTDVFPILESAPAWAGAFENIAFGERLKTADGLGSFLVVSNGSRVELREYRSLDADGDGIEDSWADQYFGHTPLTLTERQADADHDGMSNEDEFAAGTDPTDGASVLRITVAHEGLRAQLRFPCRPAKNYQILVSADLRTWGEVSDPTFSYPEPDVCVWTDDGSGTASLPVGAPLDSLFYRVRVR